MSMTTIADTEATSLSEFRQSSTTFWTRRRLIVAVVVFAALLRAWSVLQLPLDFDEPVYVQTAVDYARVLKAGNWNQVIDYPENREHPALVKLTYGLGVVALGKNANLGTDLYVSRAISAFFGALSVLLLALLNPLAGAFLAVHTMTVKYTSQAYLEALPQFTALAAIITLVWAGRAVGNHPGGIETERRRRTTRLVLLSAVFLGLTAAGKYTYFPVVAVILYLAIWEQRRSWQELGLYFAVAAATFWLFDVTLWHDPLGRLLDSVFFHIRYSQGAHVQEVGYPWYQPFVWLSQPAPWHPEVFFWGVFDTPIFALALLGVPWLWRDRRWVVIWLVAGLIFLLLWPAKWPQYTLVVIPAFCLAAAFTAIRAYRWLTADEIYWPQIRELIPVPGRAFWVFAGAFVLVLTGLYVANAIQLVAGRIGWSHFTTDNAPLPSVVVHAILPDPDGQIILGTDAGVAIWSPSPGASLESGAWTVWTAENSGLVQNRVLSLARDPAGAVWFGTDTGLSRYARGQWQTIHAQELGLATDQIRALVAGADGRVWLGTLGGAAMYDGQHWTPYTTAAGLVDNRVFSVALTPGGDTVWFGTAAGISRLDAGTGRWTSYTAGNSYLGPGAVSSLLLDSQGRLWAGTLGGGLNVWDGATWHSYRTGNSAIPYNTVQAVFEFSPGVLWVSTSIPNNAGGILTAFDGRTWRSYFPANSGYSGAEVLSFARDAEGRVWIGTRTAGVDVYQPPGR